MKVKTGFTALSVAVVASLALAACGGSSSTESSSSEAEPASSAAAPSAAPSEAPAATAAWQPAIDVSLGDVPVAGGTAANTVNPDGSVNIDVGLAEPIVVTGPPRVAVFVSGLNNSIGQVRTKGATDVAEQLGLEVVDVFDGNNDPATQLIQFQNALASGKYDAWVALPVDSKGTCKLLSEEAPAAGIVVVVQSASLCDTDTAHDDEVWTPGTLGYVGGVGCGIDGYTYWANQIPKHVTGPQRIGLLTGPDFQSCTQNFMNAAKAVIEEQGWTLSGIYNGEYTQDAGYKGAQTLMNADPELTSLWSAYSENALGAVKALDAASVDNITIFDIGAVEAIMDPIREGKVTFSLALRPIGLGASAMKLIAQAFSGQPTPRSLSNDGSPLSDGDFVTKENIESFVPEF